MEIKHQIIVFTVAVLICFIAQAVDAFLGINNAKQNGQTQTYLID